MDVFKDLFEYSVISKDDGFNISYRCTYEKEAVISVYFYKLIEGNKRVIVSKLGYRKELQKYHLALESGRYQIKFFIKLKEETSYFDALLTPVYELEVLSNYLPQLLNLNELSKIISKLALNGLNNIDFKVISGAKAGAYSCPPNFFEVLSESAIDLLKRNKYGYSTTEFLLNCIFYTGNKEFLLRHMDYLLYELINNKSEQKKKDILFWFGVANYKTGKHLIATKAFSGLIEFKDDLRFYQTGSISYIDSLETLDTLEINEIDNGVQLAKNFDHSCYIGCLLISCDYGYYKVYLEDQLEKLNGLYLIHVHFILIDNTYLNSIRKDIDSFDNVNYSYEIVSSNVYNIRTYYSISRYLILSDIIKIYSLPVIIADADLDFNRLDLMSVFESTDSKSIYLNEVYSDLPWFKVLAGFSVFGKDAVNSKFISNLKKYLSSCYYTGRDGWMLDQVALCQCLEFHNSNDSKDDIKIYNLNDSFKVDIKQVPNRVEKRLMISKF